MGEAESIYESELERSNVNGSVLDIEEVCSRFPEVANELREIHLGRTLSDVAPLPRADPPRRAPRFRPISHEFGAVLGQGGMGRRARGRRPGLCSDASRSRSSRSRRRSMKRVFFAKRASRRSSTIPAIPPVHEILETEDGRPCFAMQLVDGETLTTVIENARARREGWTIHRVLEVLERVGEALAYAHSRGVIHRDVKPDNIMVGAFGEVYVMDWGLARILDESETRRSTSPRDPWPQPALTQLAGNAELHGARTGARRARGRPGRGSVLARARRSTMCLAGERPHASKVRAQVWHAEDATHADSRRAWSARRSWTS